MVDSLGQKAASSPLLGTKLYGPRSRSGLVSRPRLSERLDQAIAGKLTLVSAPAGFGKTTLLAEWIAMAPADERPVAWLSLDEHDNHPTSFWTYLITALQTVQPELGVSTIALLQSPQPPPIQSLLAGLLNEVGASSRNMVLVLDDYHLIDARPIHDGIEFLLDHLPRPLHLVIAGRADPPLPLARLRARGELVEIRAADLRFSADEAAAFLTETMHLDLAAPDIAALDARTEGWIAGLQLAALSMQGRDDVTGFIAAFAGDDRYIVDYLVEEVLERQPAEVRGFLLETSILDRLSGPLCDAVTARADGKGTLDALERSNLFVVPLDDQRHWYRYHRLFADVLQAHLLEEEPDEVARLHARASNWFELNAQRSDAIRHALAANDPGRAAGLVELAAEALVRSHQPDRLIELLKPIPDDLIRSMPVLSTYYSHALLGVGELEAAASRLSDAERWLSDAVDTIERPTATSEQMVVVDREGLRSLPSRIALARSYCAMAADDVAGAVERAQRALELLPEDEHHWRGAAAGLLAVAHWTRGDLGPAQKFSAEAIAHLERAGDMVLAMSTAYHHADLLKARGRLTEAQRIYERSLQLAIRHGGLALSGMASLHFGLSEFYCDRDDLESATQHLRQGEDIGDSAALPAIGYRRRIAQARLRQAHGDLDGALDLLDQAEPLKFRGPVPDIRPVAALKARLWIAQGRLAEALSWARAEAPPVGGDLDYRREFQHITLARVLIAKSAREQDDGALREAGELLERLLGPAEAGGRGGAVLEILVLQAVVHRALGDIPAGLTPLERALRLAEPEGYVRLFVDEGEPMRDLLRRAAASAIGGAYTRRLLSAFGGPADLASVPPRVGVLGLAEPLTAREVEILRLIAAGMRNREIADHLVISLSTVKRHIANGYGKLGVTHRIEAVARLNELTLL